VDPTSRSPDREGRIVIAPNDLEPILVGACHTVNPSVYEGARSRCGQGESHYTQDLRDWAHFYGIRIGNPTCSRQLGKAMPRGIRPRMIII